MTPADEHAPPPPWRIHHRAETVSTNLDARTGAPGDVFTADHQTAGRGRLDHRWLSPPGTNLLMSVVLSVAGLEPEQIATLPLAMGLAVCEGLAPFVPSACGRALKWPNDVLAGGRKLAGILCERQDDWVIVGVGVNVRQTAFPPELAARATSLALLGGGAGPSVASVRDAVLDRMAAVHRQWRAGGFAAVYPRIAAVDCLRGRRLAVRQTDDDAAPVCGVCDGIQPDGSLGVGGARVYAGEAHVLRAEDFGFVLPA